MAVKQTFQKDDIKALIACGVGSNYNDMQLLSDEFIAELFLMERRKIQFEYNNELFEVSYILNYATEGTDDYMMLGQDGMDTVTCSVIDDEQLLLG